MSKTIDMVGLRIGMLTVIREAGRKNRGTTWFCVCDCGKECVRLGTHLRSHAKSCGCQQWAGNSRKHGEATKTKEYRTWKGIKSRCLNVNDQAYKNYGGRGIKIHPPWIDSYEIFLRDVGRAPGPEYSIDRINNDGNYEPGNIRWATKLEQARNSRVSHWIEFHGELRTVGQWAKRLGIAASTLSGRLQRGWPLDEAFTLPLRAAPTRRLLVRERITRPLKLPRRPARNMNRRSWAE